MSPRLCQALAAHGGLILPGDEIVQVNEQLVVSWGTRAAGFGRGDRDRELQGWEEWGILRWGGFEAMQEL